MHSNSNFSIPSSSRDGYNSSTGHVFSPKLLGVGAYGLVYKLSDLVVVKIQRDSKDAVEAFANEQKVFGLLGRQSPYLIPCIYQTPSATFMMRASRDLRDVINSKSYNYRSDIAARWMGQLCGGAAFMEKQGYAHGDLRPDNLLIDRNDNLRIHDFGSTLPVGNRLPTGTEPFARLLSKDDGEGRGTYGWAGAYTENFAIGSIYYSITRGYYPYAREKYNQKTLMGMCQRKEFPQLTDSIEDRVISMCWYGMRKSVAELEQVFRNMAGGTEWYLFDAETDEWVTERLEECVTWASAGGVDSLHGLAETFIVGKSQAGR